jgi:EAL domain-containing protein (putative c-di-GMP-specific phosphodiesterase class I)
MIVPVGQWVIRHACRAAAAWNKLREPDARPLRVSVNVSGRELADPDFVRGVERAIAMTRVDPHLLALELPAPVLTGDLDGAVRLVDALRSLGVGIILDRVRDDSVLPRIGACGFDSVKIHRTLISRLGTSPEHTARVAAVIEAAHARALPVTAVGIEHALQLSVLRALGGDNGQGYYFARPQPREVVVALVLHPFRWRADAQHHDVALV